MKTHLRNAEAQPANLRTISPSTSQTRPGPSRAWFGGWSLGGSLVLGAWCLWLLPGQLAFGQSYSIDWFKIAGGGGTSTNGQYSISGTIGQPDVGHLSGGNYTIDGGFWGIIAAIQTPGAPLLTITRSGASVIISWPSPSPGFVPQQNNSVANPNGWSNFSGMINDNGIVKSITVSPPVGNLFFRLKGE